MRTPNFSEPINPYDIKAQRYALAYEHARDKGDLRMADRFWNGWQRMIQKGTEWEIGLAQVRCEILDAVAAYEKRVGLR